MSGVLQQRKKKKELHFDADPYKPYDGMEDTLRNRLIMFVAKWSADMIKFEKGEVATAPSKKDMLDDRCLVKWETSDPSDKRGNKILELAREFIRLSNGDEDAVVLDPFAGGGSIPLEAGRLGCQPIANDYNPVAYLILRATCEFPQKFGKPGRRPKSIDASGRSTGEESKVKNVLAHDLEIWAHWILNEANKQIGHLYVPSKKDEEIVGYIWARTAPCSNPSCRGEIPLLRSLLLCNKPNKKVALKMGVNKRGKSVKFNVLSRRLEKQGRRKVWVGDEIEDTDGTMQSRGNVLCPFCEEVTPVAQLREAGIAGQMGNRLVAVIVNSDTGKEYRKSRASDEDAFLKAEETEVDCPSELIPDNQWNVKTWLYGMNAWGLLFNKRQLVAMQTFVGLAKQAMANIKAENDSDYAEAVSVYLGLWISRIAQRMSNVGVWHTSRETLEHPFGRQAIPMTWDYPEANPFSDSTGGALGGIDWIKRVILHESIPSLPSRVHRGDGARLAIDDKSVNHVVTDPPYFDAIAYADLSDYFYVWLKRTLGEGVPDAFGTPLTPKSDEATALKHRHEGSEERAETHFRTKLAESLAECKRVLKPGGVVTVMFAHQSTKAWTALINAIFDAGLTVDATWPIDTELTTALKGSMSALASSVTVVCRPRVAGSASSFKKVRSEVREEVAESISRFWSYGFRGADLIVACYGPAVGVFGRYDRVERADGTLVGVPELLEMARVAARDAIAGDFRGDNISTLYYVWTNLYGISEQAWDDARLVIMVGGDEDDAIEVARQHHIFVVEGSKCRLALLSDRAKQRNLGMDQQPLLIDALHRAMLLWKQEKRKELISYLDERGLLADGPIWKLAQALWEVLPRDTDDWKLVSALLRERDTMRREAKAVSKVGKLGDLFNQ